MMTTLMMVVLTMLTMTMTRVIMMMTIVSMLELTPPQESQSGRHDLPGQGGGDDRQETGEGQLVLRGEHPPGGGEGPPGHGRGGNQRSLLQVQVKAFSKL